MCVASIILAASAHLILIQFLLSSELLKSYLFGGKNTGRKVGLEWNGVRCLNGLVLLFREIDIRV